MNIKLNLAAQVGRMRNQIEAYQNHTSDEIEKIGSRMPVMAMKDANAFKLFVEKEKLSLTDCAVLVAWIDTMSDFLMDIEVKNDEVTYENASKFYERARSQTITIHRVNYIYFMSILNLFNALEKDKRFRFEVRRAANKVEKEWTKLLHARSWGVERSAWSTLQDHLRLYYDAVSSDLNKVYEAIRDNMIFLGMKDVEVKAYCAVALLMGKVSYHTHKAFFSDFERECGVDYTKCFAESDLFTMSEYFAEVCKIAGYDVKQDVNGCYSLADYDVESCERFKVAWKKYIKTLRNDDLMDESAERAINLNPAAKEEYSQIIEEEKQKHLDADIQKLGEKFKVTKL